MMRAQKDMDFKITMVYGENDFFKPHGGEELLKDGTIKHGNVFIAKNCGHHIYFDDPKQCLDLLLPSFFEIENTVAN